MTCADQTASGVRASRHRTRIRPRVRRTVLQATAALTGVAVVVTASPAAAAPSTPSTTSTPAAPLPGQPRLQRLVDQVVELGAPGASLLVREAGSTRTFTSGVADVGTGRPLRAEDHYRSGSTTKTMIATLVLHTNYVVLGLLLREVTDQKVKTQLADRILRPLGLDETTWPIRSTSMPRPFTHGYLRDPSGELLEATSAFSPSWAWAAGALISTTRDLADFSERLLGGDLVSPRLLDEMKVPGPSGDYGLGLVVADVPCGTAYGHDGIFFGYFTFELSTEDGSRQAVVMMNVDPVNGDPPPDALEAAIDAAVAGLCDGADGPSTALELPELGVPPLRPAATAGRG